MRRGDVVLVHVPNVGSPGGKMRPAVVVQSDLLNGTIRETIIAAVTSNLSNVHQPHQLLIDISTSDGAASGLLMNSAVRCERLHTIPQADVRKTLGAFTSAMMQQVDACMKAALAIR